jgi:3',5'-cyclic AMP phosphodiesterase CpdA
MLIAQISDFHVTRAGELAYGRVDTNAALANAIKVLKALRPQPDLVIGSGDLTQSGSDDEYSVLLNLLARLDAPFAPLMGNHDRRASFRRAFPDLTGKLHPDGFVQYVQDVGPLKLIVLDTVQEGADDPDFCEARASWLQAELESERPTILAMHHPPFSSGVGWLDPTKSDWSAPLASALHGRRQVVKILCGHVHRGIHTTWKGIAASSAPSTAHQVDLDLLPDAPPRLTLEAPGFHLHHWDGRNLHTYTAAVPGFASRFSPMPSANPAI